MVIGWEDVSPTRSPVTVALELATTNHERPKLLYSYQLDGDCSRVNNVVIRYDTMYITDAAEREFTVAIALKKTFEQLWKQLLRTQALTRMSDCVTYYGKQHYLSWITGDI